MGEIGGSQSGSQVRGWRRTGVQVVGGVVGLALGLGAFGLVRSWRLGTRDAVLWWHLARVEAHLGLTAEARDHLAHAFSINPYLTVRDLPAASALATEIGVPGQ